MNCKVHFAGTDNTTYAISALRAANVNYRLFTAYPFIKNKKSSYAVDLLYEPKAGFKHIIVDSGLFTLMFGAQKNNSLTRGDLRDWMKRIVQFAEDNHLYEGFSFVECDCQKLMGPELAWELRKEMRELMGGREIINVFHLEDGADGFDKLVDFSDYIAISVPELRFNKGSQYKQITATLARRARMLKPSIKIHLLGCTEIDMLRQNKFVTSSDSSSWTAPARFGTIGDNHIKTFKQDAIRNAFNTVQLQASSLGFPTIKPNERNVRYIGTYFISAKLQREKYIQACGSQD